MDNVMAKDEMARVRNRSLSCSNVSDGYGDAESWEESVQFGLASKLRRKTEEVSAGDMRIGFALRLAGEPTIGLSFSRSLPLFPHP